jgi:hypothetical protein
MPAVRAHIKVAAQRGGATTHDVFEHAMLLIGHSKQVAQLWIKTPCHLSKLSRCAHRIAERPTGVSVAMHRFGSRLAGFSLRLRFFLSIDRRASRFAPPLLALLRPRR